MCCEAPYFSIQTPALGSRFSQHCCLVCGFRRNDIWPDSSPNFPLQGPCLWRPRNLVRQEVNLFKLPTKSWPRGRKTGGYIQEKKKKKKVLSIFFLPFFTCLNHTPPWAPRSFSKTSGFSTSSDNSLPPEGFGSHLLAVWPGTNCLTSLNCVVRATKKGNDKSN